MWTETLNSSNTTPPKKNNPQCSTPSQLSRVPFFHPKNIPTPTKGTNKPHLHKVPPRWLEVAFFRQNHPDWLWLPKCIRHQNSSKLHCTISQSPPLETGWEFGGLCHFFCSRKSSLKSSSWWFQVSTHLKMLVKLGIFPKGGEDTTYLKPPASLYLLVTQNLRNTSKMPSKKESCFNHINHTLMFLLRMNGEGMEGRMNKKHHLDGNLNSESWGWSKFGGIKVFYCQPVWLKHRSTIRRRCAVSKCRHPKRKTGGTVWSQRGWGIDTLYG